MKHYESTVCQCFHFWWQHISKKRRRLLDLRFLFFLLRFVWFGAYWAADLKGTMSCRTQGRISARPSVHLSIHFSAHPSICSWCHSLAVYTMALIMCDWAGAVMQKPIAKCQKSKCGTNWLTNQATNGPTDRLTDGPRQGHKLALVTGVGQGL